jgi:adenylate cyclase
MDSYLSITGVTDRRVTLAEKRSWVIGRGRGNDIVIDHASISRRHAMLQVTDSGEVYLVDCGSRNGSFLNGYRVSMRIKLTDGDRLTFGEASAEFRCTETTPMGSEIRTVGGTVPVQQRRMVSVLVVDIRDFTVLSREIGEQKLAELIGCFFQRAGKIIHRYSSRMEKYIGDAVMGVWFHDENEESDLNILRPFEAAGAIHRVTIELNAEFTLPFQLRVGAGVNTGFAMVGNSGGAGAADFTALGDTVNAAFRLESATKAIGCDIAIGELTYKRLQLVAGESIPFVANSVHLKGMGPATAYSCRFADLDAFLTAAPSD